ncbi:hypothetical protein ABID19_000198 [Mesorhizobium robiniae]|uniref:Transposase DDE domain-containing protein n=1 Tax=Mesorhizobium robiniae TaxID=559315 RepID=A0ABV2GFV6_9HYPH
MRRPDGIYQTDCGRLDIHLQNTALTFLGISRLPRKQKRKGPRFRIVRKLQRSPEEQVHQPGSLAAEPAAVDGKKGAVNI